MNRGDVVYTNLLVEGDRFYFITDKKKTPWQVKTQEKKKAQGYGGHFQWLYTIIWQPERSNATRHIRIHQVVFLRSTIAKPETI
jgi:hypothetical protein